VAVSDRVRRPVRSAVWHIDDIEGIQGQLVRAGAEIQSPIAHVRGDRLIATLTDPDGNPIGLLQDTA